MKLEQRRVARFIYSTLTADAGAGGFNTLLGGRVYPGLVKQGAALPAATIAVAVGLPTLTLAGTRVWQNVQVDVGLHADGGSMEPINAAADRALTLLQGLSGMSDGVLIVKLRQTDAREFTDVDSGKTYSHVVQTFTTEAHEL